MLTLKCNQSLWLVKLNIIKIGSNVLWISLRFLRRKKVEVSASLARSSGWPPGHVAPAFCVTLLSSTASVRGDLAQQKCCVQRLHMRQGRAWVNLAPRPSVINLSPFLPWDPGMRLPQTLEIFWSTPPYTHMTGFLFLSLPWLVSTFPIHLKWRKRWVQYSTWLYQHRCPGSV